MLDEEEIEHYTVRITIGGTEHYCLWFTSEEDGLVANSNGEILRGGALAVIQAAASQMGIVIEDQDPATYDFDSLQEWLNLLPEGEAKVDCPELLNAWNLFLDFATSTGQVGAKYLELQKEMNVQYDKLFWGNNLPVITPAGEEYIPEWEDKEILAIGILMAEGIELVKSSLVE